MTPSRLTFIGTLAGLLVCGTASAETRVNIGAVDADAVYTIARRVEMQHEGRVVRALPQRRFLTVSVPDATPVLDDSRIASLSRYVERDQVIELPERREWLRAMARGEAPFPQGLPGADAALVPNDPKYGEQWGPACVDAEAAWAYGPADDRVIVAIIDTGIDLSHPDIKANIDPDLDWDFVGNDSRPKDDMGHGTHCAGVIAAITDNGVGVAGLAQVTLVGIKAVNWLGMGMTSDIVAAVYHAGDIGAHFVNMSLGFTADAASLRNAIEEVSAEGTLIIAAAGNSGNKRRTYPASYPEVVGVSALARSCDQLAGFSSYGFDNVELTAPGEAIYSTLPDHSTWWNLMGLLPLDYGEMSGTSMACPHVVGVAAGYKAYDYSLTTAQVRSYLASFADDLGDAERYGHGRLDYYPFAD